MNNLSDQLEPPPSHAEVVDGIGSLTLTAFSFSKFRMAAARTGKQERRG
jgi:hypothetical protein